MLFPDFYGKTLLFPQSGIPFQKAVVFHNKKRSRGLPPKLPNISLFPFSSCSPFLSSLLLSFILSQKLPKKSPSGRILFYLPKEKFFCKLWCEENF